MTTRRRYTVRKQSSGYTASETFYVYDLVKQGRVSVYATSRQSAQLDADTLEIGAMVREYADDPRPYEVRRAEAAERFAEGVTSR
jgi:hypothetical protein